MAGNPASHTVLLTQGAAHDLERLHRYVAAADSPESADYLLERLLKVVSSLSRLPKRGKVPYELTTLGITEYREVLCKPYRLIYRIIGEQVLIYLTVDGRRDMQSALQRRLLES